ATWARTHSKMSMLHQALTEPIHPRCDAGSTDEWLPPADGGACHSARPPNDPGARIWRPRHGSGYGRFRTASLRGANMLGSARFPQEPVVRREGDHAHTAR